MAVVNKSVEDKYKKLALREQILLRPDTYCGSIEPETSSHWVFVPNDTNTDSSDESNGSPAPGRVEERKVTVSPALLKIADEVLVNAADHFQRDKTMKTLKVEINQKEGFISVYNDGTKGIEVQMHKTEKTWVPELIFCHLLTSGNYDDKEERTTGGKNGYGAKLANIFSTKFVIEVLDAKLKKSYRQECTANMTKVNPPVIKDATGLSYTRITFYPDWKRFGMTGFDNNVLALLSRRVADLAGTLGSAVKVMLNGTALRFKSFEQYVGMYLPADSPRVYRKVNDRWQVCVAPSGEISKFFQVSFVNNIHTAKGGSHVTHITDQVVKSLREQCVKKNKGGDIKPEIIKSHLAVFVNCLIVNPSFDSQTKVNLTSKRESFGSECKLMPNFLSEVGKMGLVDDILAVSMAKDANKLNKAGASGKRGGRITGIPKLEDAGKAGTADSHLCTLFLTEGDSAKALAVSGFSVVGRDFYGVFPLKGKLLNVRETSSKKVLENKEIQALAKILGLKFGVDYSDEKERKGLRYGHVCVMTDQDQDGSHIKGLLINLFSRFWPYLFRQKEYLREFITPIVKAINGKNSQELAFYTLPEYEAWKEQTKPGREWKIKYYKGLGTSTSSEAKEYFKNIDRHQISFSYIDQQDDDAIDLAFSKLKVEQRKGWLAALDPTTYLDQDVDEVRYVDFVNKELVLFSQASNVRAIPSLLDGLKPSQRKVLYVVLKNKIFKEIKVAQLGGLVAKESAYHHGEQSLAMTMVVMAQDYIGSNNINLLYPGGQFGTRMSGGKDAASARYIFTNALPIARSLFHEHDDQVLTYQDDDGQQIEPSFYVPVIPMSLVNGSDGIGTGWSSTVPNYNPLEVVENLRRILDGNEPLEMHPWYRGFKGVIRQVSQQKYVSFGVVERLNATTVLISDLPVGVWTSEYKDKVLEPMMSDDPKTKRVAQIKTFREHHTDTTVLFEVELTPDQMQQAEARGLHRTFKLANSISTANMVLFDGHGKLHRYATPVDILKEFYTIRLDYYVKRKDAQVKRLKEELDRLSNKARFILAVVEDRLKIRNVPRKTVLETLAAEKYKPFVTKKTGPVVAAAEQGDDEAQDDADTNSGVVNAAVTINGNTPASLVNGYDYLLSMSLWSLTREKVEEIKKERDRKEAELKSLMSTSHQSLWRYDLNVFMDRLKEHEDAAAKEHAKGASDKKVVVMSKRKKVTSTKPKASGKNASAAAGRQLKGIVVDPPLDYEPGAVKKRKVDGEGTDADADVVDADETEGADSPFELPSLFPSDSEEVDGSDAPTTPAVKPVKPPAKKRAAPPATKEKPKANGTASVKKPAAKKAKVNPKPVVLRDEADDSDLELAEDGSF
jgi:DNA topoisomerase-2